MKSVHLIDAIPQAAAQTVSASALQKLRTRADASLSAGPFSVMQKTELPPGGNRHDFLTLSPYLWPNPATPDGTPYVRRDGRLNPEAKSDRFDRTAYFEMSHHVRILTLAWKHTQDRRYAAHAAELIRIWFLNPETAMSPHFQFAQWAPGRSKGTQYGIIRGMTLLEVHECRRLLDGSDAWTRKDEDAWMRWVAQYVDWLITSESGQREARSRNNHGTWYDLQVVTFAAWTGDPQLARSVLHERTIDRLTQQISPDGRQPRELGRTKSWSYSVMNLRGLILLARQAERLNVDLWSVGEQNGQGIRSALDYLLPFATGNTSWPHRNIEQWQPQLLAPLLPLAAEASPDPALEEALKQIDPDGTASAFSILGLSVW